MKAYSYIRYSTSKQGDGHSRERQLTRTKEYCAAHGLTLDESACFEDLGKSAFKGEQEALPAFISHLEDGTIQTPCVLILESLDRGWRSKVVKSQRQFLHILELGCDIVTLMDQRRYSESTTDISELITSLIILSTAHEESLKRQDRLKHVWAKKLEDARHGKPIGKKIPFWLALNGTKYEVLEDKAKIVRDIFNWSVEGLGVESIVTKLNRSKIPAARGGHWVRSSLRRLLTNKAVIGTHVTMKGEEIPNLFPAILTEEIFYKSLKARGVFKGVVGAKGKTFNNLFTGAAICGVCGSPMHYIDSGKWEYLRCSKRNVKVTNCQTTLPYGLVEEAIVSYFIFNRSPLIDVESSYTSNSEIQQAEKQLEIAETKFNEMLELLSGIENRGTKKKLEELDNKIKLAENHLRALREKQKGELYSNLSPQDLVNRYSSPSATVNDRRFLNECIRKAFGKLIFLPGGMIIFESSKVAEGEYENFVQIDVKNQEAWYPMSGSKEWLKIEMGLEKPKQPKDPRTGRWLSYDS